MAAELTTDDFLWEGTPLRGLCGHCQVNVDSTDPNHRVTSIVRGGRGVECVLRGDIAAHEGGPLRAWTLADRMAAFAKELMEPLLCTSPGGGLGPGTHCAACCYGTGVIITCEEDQAVLDAGLALLRAAELVRRG